MKEIIDELEPPSIPNGIHLGDNGMHWQLTHAIHDALEILDHSASSMRERLYEVIIWI